MEPASRSRTPDAPPPHLQRALIGRWEGQSFGSLLFISWHAGEGFLLAQRLQGEGGATDPLRGTARAWQVDTEGAESWVESRAIRSDQ